MIQLTFKFQPGLGPVRIQGRGGQTMLNGILAFSILGFHLLSRLHPPYCLTSLKQSEESAPTSKTLYCAGLDFNILQLLISAVWYNTSSRQCTCVWIGYSPHKDVGTWWVFSRFPAKTVSLAPPHWRHQLASQLTTQLVTQSIHTRVSRQSSNLLKIHFLSSCWS